MRERYCLFRLVLRSPARRLASIFMVRVRRETVVLALCCLFGIAAAEGCSGNVETGTGSDVDAAGGSAGRGGSSGRGGGAGRGGGGGLDMGGAAGIGGAVAGAAGSSAGFAGSGVGGVSGRSAGGAPGRGGAAGVGGASGAGGSSTGACGSGIADCADDSADSPCMACAKLECCYELVCCAADTACSGNNGDGELSCIQNCVHATVFDGGVANDATVSSCASQCAVGTTISLATNDVLGCLLNGARADGGIGMDCFVQCFSGD
jgi:hypothetical protein